MFEIRNTKISNIEVLKPIGLNGQLHNNIIIVRIKYVLGEKRWQKHFV